MGHHLSGQCPVSTKRAFIVHFQPSILEHLHCSVPYPVGDCRMERSITPPPFPPPTSPPLRTHTPHIGDVPLRNSLHYSGIHTHTTKPPFSFRTAPPHTTHCQRLTLNAFTFCFGNQCHTSADERRGVCTFNFFLLLIFETNFEYIVFLFCVPERRFFWHYQQCSHEAPKVDDLLPGAFFQTYRPESSEHNF